MQRAHRIAGLFMALFLVIAGLSGTAIAFYSELDRMLNPELYRVTVRSQGELNADELAHAVTQLYPGARIAQLYRDHRRGESVIVRLAAPDTTELFLDPYDGHLLSHRNHGELHFDRAHLMPFLDRLHYTLAVPGDAGRVLLGIVALVWVFDCFVGLSLTLPGPGRSWVPAWQIKGRSGFGRFNFDLHRAGSLWTWLVLLMLAITGVYFNLTDSVFRPVLRLFGPLSPTVVQALPHTQTPITTSFEQAISQARLALSPESRSMIVSYVGFSADAPGFYKVRFTDADRGDASWHFHIEELYVNVTSAQVALRAGHHVGTTADKVIFWQYPLHSGKVLGFWGRAFMGTMGFVVSVLSLTGVVIWARRHLRKRRHSWSRIGKPVPPPVPG